MPQVGNPITGEGTVPTGGTTDQVLRKTSNTNYQVGWVSLAAGGNVSTSGTITTGQHARWASGTTIESITAATAKTDLALNNVTNDAQIKASDFPASSTHLQVVVWNGTSGKSVGGASGSGIATLASGVIGTVTAPTGAVVGTTDTQTLTNKNITKRVSSTAAPGATPSLNTDNFDCVDYTGMTAAITNMSTNLSGSPNNFDRLIYRLKDNGTARAIAWGTSFADHTAKLPLTTVAGKTTVVQLLRDSTKSQWMCVSALVEGAGYTSLWTSVAGVNQASTSSLHCGLGATYAITPAVTGRIIVTITGNISNNTANDGVQVSLRWGTGTAPALNATATGTALTQAVGHLTATGANEAVPFSLTGYIAGTVGLSHWIDVAMNAVTGGTATLGTTTFVAYEIP